MFVEASILSGAMSDRVGANVQYFWLLLNADKKQRLALLNTADPSQVDFLAELFYNFLNHFPLSHSERKSLKKKRFLSDIANIKRSVKARKIKIVKNKGQIINILTKYHDNLQSVIDSRQPQPQP